MVMAKARRIQPTRGEIWMVDLEPTVGAEMGKIRPAVVVNVDAVGRLPLRMIVPLTTWQPHHDQLPWFVRVPVDAGNGLSQDSGADTFQIRCVSVDRFVRRMGVIATQQLADIATAIRINAGAP
jgi:mRNA interferase MazF